MAPWSEKTEIPALVEIFSLPSVSSSVQFFGLVQSPSRCARALAEIFFPQSLSVDRKGQKVKKLSAFISSCKRRLPRSSKMLFMRRLVLLVVLE